MAKTWATSGLDLHLDLAAARPRAALETALREAVRSGRLAPGTRLPSTRGLATDLSLARNTVADAYGQLVAEGWLAARHGSGTWVAERTPMLPPAAAPAALAAATPRYSLRPGVPDVSAFPRAAWLAAARRAVMAAGDRDLTGYDSVRGLPVLRAALAGYLARARGVAVAPDRIIVCSGFASGLHLICQLLVQRGEGTLAVESYGHWAHRQVATSAGVRLTAVDVDDRGAVTAGLTASAALLTPAHQYPLGVAMAPERRREAVEWAASGRLLIEDDYDGEFRYDRQAVGALQALAPERVVYAGTASKSLVPGLRLGWLVLPADLAGPVADLKAATGSLSSSIDQLTLAEFIASGGYDRQVRRARLVYRRRRDRLLAALRREVPAVRVTGIAAGLQVLVRLPAGCSEDGVVAAAAARGLRVEGLASCRAGAQDVGPALIVGYGAPPGHGFSTAVARLCAVLREETSTANS